MYCLQIKSWAVSPDLFPCELDQATAGLLEQGVAAAVAAWGERQLTELEAEERLAVACEKAPTEDAVTTKVRCDKEGHVDLVLEVTVLVLWVLWVLWVLACESLPVPVACGV